jgi:hypothetical protein
VGVLVLVVGVVVVVLDVRVGVGHVVVGVLVGVRGRAHRPLLCSGK